MSAAFYISAVIAVLATLMAITRREAIHGLLYFVVSLLAVAVAFLVLGAPFAAALEVITYAGAMMVMLLFAIMTLTPKTLKRSENMSPVTLLLAGDFVYILTSGTPFPVSGIEVSPRQVGLILFGPYALGVELASMLLLAGLVGAYHVGRRDPRE